MIRYDISRITLNQRIDACRTGWRTNAATVTAQFRRARRYSTPPPDFWGQIKSVYINLQHHKCAFCERHLEWDGEFQVEHFRPKSLVKPWPPPGRPAYLFPTGGALPGGYYLLTYHPLNYTAACGNCNVSLKRVYFPVEGTRLQTVANPARMASERPLLIYPISNIDTDPENLIGFEGVTPKPIYTDPTTYDYHRAQVTIDFFDLDRREPIRKERAHIIRVLFPALKWEHTAETQPYAQRIITEWTGPASPHCNCARSFVRLYRKDPAHAETLYDAAAQWL